MKTLPLAILILIAGIQGCNRCSNTTKNHYDSMHFDREGGGQIDFCLFATDNPDKIKAVVSMYDFLDTTMQVIIDNNTDNTPAFASFYKAMNNDIQFNGDFQQSALMTGTWAHVYLVTGGEETEVTNTELRNSLLKFEVLVRDKVK